MYKYNVVVAKYKENIDWLSRFDPEKYNIIVYDKGGEPITYPYLYSRQENIGGDAETFTRYIIEHYDNLPEYSILIQAYPFDHLAMKDPPKGEEIFWNIIEKHNDEKIVPLTESICQESINGWYEHFITRKHVKGPVYMLRDSARAILGDETPGIVIFGAGQQYIVHRDIIRGREISFYEKILERFKFDFLWPWHCERLWLYFWKCQNV